MSIRINTEKSIPFIPILDYMIVLLVILGSQSILSAASGKDYHLTALLILALLVRDGLDIKLIIEKCGNVLAFSIFWTVYILIYAALSGGDFSALFKKFFVIMLLITLWIYLSFQRHRIHDCMQGYCNIIFIVSIISLLLWMLGSLLGVIHPSGTLTIQWGRERTVYNYYYVYYQWQNDMVLFGKYWYRNIGIFTEAPMYSLHLCVAFMMEYLVFEKKQRMRILIYIITILSTFSVTGYLLLLMVIIGGKCMELASRLLRGEKVDMWMMLLPAIAIMGFVLGAHILGNKLASVSGSSRIDDYISGFKAWKENLLFGAGYGDIETRISYSSAARLARSSYGYTNSIMYVLSEGGLCFFACYFFSFAYLIINSIRQNKYKLTLFAVMWFYLFLTTVFPHTAIMICWLAYAFVQLIYTGEGEAKLRQA